MEFSLDTARETGDMIMNMATVYGMSVLGAIIILIVGWTAAKWASTLVYKAILRTPIGDETLAQFFRSLMRYAVMAFTLIAVLSQFGVQTASLVALLGAAGLAIGLAMQGTLSNIAAGVMLLIFRPFKIGDYVEVAGDAGTVKQINLFVTELAMPDNVQIIIPNANIWGQAITNYSANPTRRVDVPIGIDYKDDINLALQTATKTLTADSRVLADPAPQVAVGDLGDNGVNLIVRAWVKKGD